MGKVARKPINLVKTARRDPDVARVVTVACKLPNGLILCTQHWENETEQTLHGPKSVPVSKRDPIQYKIRGNALPFGMPPGFPMEGGYALTPNIPKEFWEKWLEQNKESDIVKHKLIFAYEKPADTEACAREHAKLETGLEPLLQQHMDDRGRIINRDPRLKSIGSIGTFDKQYFTQ